MVDHFCSTNPSNLIRPLKVNSKFVVEDENINMGFKDVQFYEELNTFNLEMLRDIDYLGDYFLKKDKRYENSQYYEKLYGSKRRNMSDLEHFANAKVRPLVPKRSHFINELYKL